MSNHPRRVPIDALILTPKMRNRLAAEHAEKLRACVDEAMKVMPRQEIAELLVAHQMRVLRA